MAEHPFYRFYRSVKLAMPIEQYRRMPRHPAFKHEYWKGHLRWTPRPDSCDAYLALDGWERPAPSLLASGSAKEAPVVRPLQDDDWSGLATAFYMASANWPPLGQWDGPAPRRAARCIMEWSRREKDGPLVRTACMVALSPRDDGDTERIIGAALVHMIPAKHLDSAPAGVEFLPHLDWIFVAWPDQRRGVAARLLEATVLELRALGHSTLASTALTVPPASLLWHWRMGFRLAAAG